VSDFSVRAEFEPLEAVRVHEPGLELWSGAVDPGPNLFEDPVPPAQARREHRRIAETLAAAGVEVHHLADDLAAAGVLDDLVRERVTVPADGPDLEERRRSRRSTPGRNSRSPCHVSPSNATPASRPASDSTAPSRTSTSSGTRPSSATADRSSVT